ncbi:MAG TPA: hypothetical protein VGF77_13490 [Allosphingosinicella sp.]
MSRLLTLLMTLAFLATQGASVEEAICRHGSGAAHELALHNVDKRIAAQASAEDDANSVIAKKGGLSHGDPVSPPADLLTPPSVALPVRAVDRIRHALTDAPAWAGLSIPPLLQPPLG